MTILAEQSTAEGRIFNEVVALLDRQRDEPVGGALNELHAQLQAIYDGKSKDFDVATCQMGLALLHFGLGNHEEAKRQTLNAKRTGGGEEHIASNALVLLLNTGEFLLAHEAAQEAGRRFVGNPTILRQASIVLQDTLDFRASADCIEKLLKMTTNDVEQAAITVHLDLMQGLAERADELGYSAHSLIERAVCAVEALRSQKHKIFWVQLRGTKVNSVALEFHVDANAETCAELNFVIADALIENFDDTAMDLITMSTRSFAGRPSAMHSTITELHA